MKNPFSNTTSLSNAHCRVTGKEDNEEAIRLSVDRYGDNEKVVRFVYENSQEVVKLFDELSLKYTKRAFGIIPTYRAKGGYVMLKSLHESINSISLNTKFINFEKSKDKYRVFLDKEGELYTGNFKKIVFAFGGFGGKFLHTDCFRYTGYDILDTIQSRGVKVNGLECMFIHPFGYKDGRLILTGKESSTGQFIFSDGNQVFDEKISKDIRENNYHEKIDEIAQIVLNNKSSGREIYFENDKKRVKIVPTTHYTAGGIKTDMFGKTYGFDNVYAIGECRSDGNKKGGRLPGYAFTSSIVHAKNIAKNIT